jgi:hypothetical protein
VQVTVVLRTSHDELALWSYDFPFEDVVSAQTIHGRESAVAAALGVTSHEAYGGASPTGHSVSRCVGGFIRLVGLDARSKFDRWTGV